MLRKIMKILGGLVLTVIVLALIVYLGSGPQRPDSDSVSASWLEAGPFPVGQVERVFEDSSRATMENRGVPGRDSRVLNSTIWYPEGLDGQLPLIVHSHGILSSRTEMPYLMEALASHGYVVVASDYPLTSGATEGGANAEDVINQPADVSFLIDSVLALAGDEKPFTGNINPERIGLSGYSLGGLTTYLTTFHPELRDPRVAAVVAIAGPSAPFAPRFFQTSSAPVLAVAGTADALIEYERNVSDLPARLPGSEVLAIRGGSHLGFVGAADPTFRFMHNPDSLGCAAVLNALGEDPNAVFAILGNPAQGVDMSRDLPGICDEETMPEALHPGEQHMITQIAVLAFFESVFHPDPARREAARQAYSSALARDFDAAEFVDQ